MSFGNNYRDPVITGILMYVLQEHWQDTEREKRLFFCQIEALETDIYITEGARQYGDTWIENELRCANQDANPEFYRIAFKEEA